jgi:PAS domain S-box-containing protein
MAADHARQHLMLLARAGEVLSTAIDNYEPVLAALVDVVVPDFADWCGVDVVEPGRQLRRLAVRQVAEQAASPELSQGPVSLEDFSEAAARTGATQLLARSSGPPGRNDRLGPAARNPADCVIVPVVVRQQTFALITVAADPSRPGYEPSDIAVVEQLAGRASLTVERVILYRELRAREAQWRSLVEATPAGIVEVDLDGRILVWNRFAAAMFGWDRSTAPSFAQETTDALSELWLRAARGEEIVDTQISALVANRERRDLAVSVAPLRAAGGAVAGILTLAVDVSERRRFQEGLQAAQRTEALGQVAGAIAHDFNNLLTVITGYTELLRRRTLDDEGQRLLDTIRNSADKAAMLTSQLLAVGHRQVAKPVVLVPASAIEAMADVVSRILGVDITLAWRLDDVTGNIRIDPGQLERIIINLAINARDAMPEGGTVTISVGDESFSMLEGAPIGIAAGRVVRLTVADTGIGMDKETRQRCLEPFFTTKDRSKGTGLGLAAVKGIVDEAGGAITVESYPGVGTTFTIYLPAVEEEPAIVDAVPQGPVFRGTETVLIVDDETDVRRLMRTVLSHDGYRVLEAASGAEAISVAKHWEGSIDLLVTDVMMPGMHGAEVAAAAREIQPSIEVLLISGYTDDVTLPAETETDRLAFLAKPFKPSELADRVRGILDHRSE